MNPDIPPLPPGFLKWQRGRFSIASGLGIMPVRGIMCGGLGLALISATKARHKRKDGTRKVWLTWTLAHLNTGHAIAHFYDIDLDRLMPVVAEIEGLGDWDFAGLEGWRNSEPELKDRYQNWRATRAPKQLFVGSGNRDEASAIAIGIARA